MLTLGLRTTLPSNAYFTACILGGCGRGIPWYDSTKKKKKRKMQLGKLIPLMLDSIFSNLLKKASSCMTNEWGHFEHLWHLSSRLLSTLYPKITVLFNINFAPPYQMYLSSDRENKHSVFSFFFLKRWAYTPAMLQHFEGRVNGRRGIFFYL